MHIHRTYNDVGGQAAGRVEHVEQPWLHWQKVTEGLRNVLGDARRRLVSVDEVRRVFESFDADRYNAGFYERRTEAMATLLVEKGVLKWAAIGARMNEISARSVDDHTSHDSAHVSHDGHVHLDAPENTRHELMALALRELLIEVGLVTADEVRAMIERLESPGVHLGARIVAKAWVDAPFKQRLLADGKAACGELGIVATEAQIVVVENTPTTHNLVVCTLCSCYPRSILGQPPAWYVSQTYRSRAVREPRAGLAELGLDVPLEVQVSVHDSTADMRYLVLPMRPTGTEGLGEEALAELVTRDSLIGTAVPS